MEDFCAVCAEPLEWVAYGPCGHKDVCSTCIARLRFVLNDKRCCICKQECHCVFVTKALGDFTKIITDFKSLPDQMNSRSTNLWYESGIEAYFDDTDHFKMMKAMLRLSCSVCEQTEDTPAKEGMRKGYIFRNLDLLRKHLYHTHRFHMCDLCLEGRKIFLCEQTLFSRGQLDRHLKGEFSTDIDTGFTGHPLCEFCKKRFYGENELYQHMSTEHFTCHICQRQRPEHFDYYRNYADLEGHFRHDHFLCDDEDCLAKKFVVFVSEAEFKRHSALAHGGNMSRSQRNAALQIPVSFQYRSFRPNRMANGGHAMQVRDRISDTESATDLESVIRDSLSLATHMRPPLISANSTNEGLESNSNSTMFNNISRNVSTVSEVTPGSLREASFPPLPGSSGRKKDSRSNRPPARTMAARLAGERGQVRVIKPIKPRLDLATTSSREVRPLLPLLETSKPWPNLSMAKAPCPPDETNGAIGSSANGGFIPHRLLSKEEIRAANKALMERMREDLMHDEARFKVIKDISSRFGKGEIDAKAYFKKLLEFGLSHLVPEMARLCPDLVKQKALREAYQDGLRSVPVLENNRGKSKGRDHAAGSSNGVVEVLSKDGYRDAKGKSKISGSNSSYVEGSWMPLEGLGSLSQASMWTCDICTLNNRSSDNHCVACGISRPDNLAEKLLDSNAAEKRKKKTSKFDRTRLGETKTLLSANPNTYNNRVQALGHGASNRDNSLHRGVWKNGGGQRLLSSIHRELP